MSLCHQDLAQVTQRYVMLKGRVSGLAGVSGGALQRVTRLTAEARDLLDKASSSKKKLEGAGAACGWGAFPAIPTPLCAHLPGDDSPGHVASAAQEWGGLVTGQGSAP